MKRKCKWRNEEVGRGEEKEVKDNRREVRRQKKSAKEEIKVEKGEGEN